LRSHIGIDGRILIRPDELADEAGIEIERLDVAIHLLSQMGLIRRSYNFTIMANLLLNRSVDYLAGQIENDKVPLFQDLVADCGVSDKSGKTLDLPTIAQTINIDPLLLDRFLTQLSSKGWAVYRPWDRGYILEPQENMLNGENVALDKLTVNALIRKMKVNLRRVIIYAESLGAGECRREYVVKHFDEVLENKPKPCCDLCDSGMRVPWGDIPSEEVPDLPSTVNPEYIVLQAVRWNESLEYGQYTGGTLAKILKGDSFMDPERYPDPIKRLRRKKRMESSPYFSVLQGFRGGEKAIDRSLNLLLERGYLRLNEISFKNGEEDVIYNAPNLSEKGWEVIRSGRYI